METVFTKENLVETLKSNVVTVTFIKVNGTERVMKCTLIPEKIGTSMSANGEVTMRSNDKVLGVWDLENNGWRAFRIDSIKSISIG
jgi:hypothetical protein